MGGGEWEGRVGGEGGGETENEVGWRRGKKEKGMGESGGREWEGSV